MRGSPRIWIPPPPSLLLLLLEGRGHACRTDGEADGVVGELVDEGSTDAVASVAAAVYELAERVVLALAAESDAAFTERKRPYALHIDGARQALPDQRCVRGLVDDHAVDELGRILVEFDAAVPAGADLLAAIEQGAAELFGHAADVDHLGAAIDALHGQAGEPGDRVGDADVGKPADVFGTDGFDDRGGFLLGLDRSGDACADARDPDGVQGGGLRRPLGLVGRCLLGQYRQGGRQCRCTRECQQGGRAARRSVCGLGGGTLEGRSANRVAQQHKSSTGVS